MAATMEAPARLTAGGRSRSHTHSRKSATQMDPSQFAAINGAAPSTNGAIFGAPTELHTAHHHPASSTDTIRAMPDQSPHLHLPHPPSFSTPNAQRSKSWERRKSVGLPTHLSLEENGYGFPSSGARAIDNGSRHPSWSTRKEFIAALLVPLPFALQSLALGYGLGPKQKVDPSTIDDLHGSDILHQAPLSSPRNGSILSLQIICSITSVTLLLVGLRGKLSRSFGHAERRKSHADFSDRTEPRRWTLMARKIFFRMIAVGLPLYAASVLGIRVGLILLLAMVSNILTQDQRVDFASATTVKQLLARRKTVIAATAIQLISDMAGLTNQMPVIQIFLAYLALALSVIFMPPPYPSYSPRSSIITSNAPASIKPTSAVLSTPWEVPPSIDNSSSMTSSGISPLICTAEDITLTLYSGTISGAMALLLLLLASASDNVPLSRQLWTLPASCAGALALIIVDTKSLWTSQRLGFVIGSSLSCLTLAVLHSEWSILVYQGILIGVSYGAMRFDDKLARSSSHPEHSHHTSRKSISTEYGKVSGFTKFILLRTQGWPLLHSIMVEKDSRRIFYFMCLNFAFMLVQTFYGIATGSLGLLSDSVHMFFDCLALVVGLCAAVMSKWPPSTRFPYGFGKMDTLAGFANGIFLMLISIEIVYEALERLAEGNRIQRLGELLTVSALGLAVNVVGMAAFGHAHHGHGHGHSHGHEGHDHGGHTQAVKVSHGDHSHHDHSHHDHSHHNHSDHSHHDHSHHDHSHHDHGTHEHSHNNPSSRENHHHDHVVKAHANGHSHPTPHNVSPQNFDVAPLSAISHYSHLHDHSSAGPSPTLSGGSSFPPTPSEPVRLHSHDHASHSHGHGHHHHHHGNENMHGIFLHVLADTLGSVAVVISTLLIHFYGWSGFDPIASCLIAILIFASAIPLVKMSASKLLLAVPEDYEYDLREALGGIAGLRGIVGYAVPKFWLDEGDDRRTLGSIHVVAGRGSDLEDVKERCIAHMKSRGMDVLVQVEREGAERCWCQSSK